MHSMTAEKGMVDIIQLLTVLKELNYGYFCWPSTSNVPSTVTGLQYIIKINFNLLIKPIHNINKPCFSEIKNSFKNLYAHFLRDWTLPKQ